MAEDSDQSGADPGGIDSVLSPVRRVPRHATGRRRLRSAPRAMGRALIDLGDVFRDRGCSNTPTAPALEVHSERCSRAGRSPTPQIDGDLPDPAQQGP